MLALLVYLLSALLFCSGMLLIFKPEKYQAFLGRIQSPTPVLFISITRIVIAIVLAALSPQASLQWPIVMLSILAFINGMAGLLLPFHKTFDLLERAKTCDAHYLRYGGLLAIGLAVLAFFSI